ncbi:MAG: Xylose isomerase domain protein barrel [Verrucomicrobiales bacterium]|jgi:L-ribulose-5-phosphate 3-epimerase|nr:Xylose isomerase domain protein barrel [Verrucomicrobiales bacterium]
MEMNRRTFIQAGVAAGAVAGLFPSEAQEAGSKKRQLKKAIMYSTIGVGKGVEEKFAAAKEAGFEGVEPMSHLDQQEVLESAKKHGLVLPSVCCSTHWAKPVSDISPVVRADGVEGLKQALRDAKAYGSTSVLFVPAVVSKQVSYGDAYTRSQAEIRKAIPLAEELGVKIAIENVWNKFLLSPLEAARYVDEFKSEAVGWHFDIGNVIKDGWPEQWIHILGKRIQKLHIKEFSRAKMDKSGPYAGFQIDFLEGDNDWPAVMKALDAIGYQGWGIAEQGGGNSAEGLKNLTTRMDKIFAM